MAICNAAKNAATTAMAPEADFIICRARAAAGREDERGAGALVMVKPAARCCYRIRAVAHQPSSKAPAVSLGSCQPLHQPRF